MIFMPFGENIFSIYLVEVGLMSWKFGLRKFCERVSHVLPMCHIRHADMHGWFLKRCFLIALTNVTWFELFGPSG